jgi:kynurenine 3-monooxygenase
MNAAFEDCSVFDQCREDSDRLWNEAFAEFERRRWPNTDAIADMARLGLSVDRTECSLLEK